MKKMIKPLFICIAVMIAAISILHLSAQNADQRMIDDIEARQGVVTKHSEHTATTTQTITAQNVFPVYEDNGSLSIGSKDAKIIIEEFSSLSCPHCATFHNATLSDLKKDYVDTGHVRFVFHDFPLNKPALDASLLLKCLPVSDRYEFMNLLFKQQEQWAFENNHRTLLKQYAALLGLSNDKAEACMDDRETEKKIFTQMRDNSTKYQVKSTPTFVIHPSKKQFTGAKNYGAFSVEIERLMKEAQ